MMPGLPSSDQETELRNLVAVEDSVDDVQPALRLARLHQKFQHHFPFVQDPHVALRIAEVWKLEEPLGLYTCLRLCYPELLHYRDEIVRNLRPLCVYLDILSPELDTSSGSIRWPYRVRAFDRLWRQYRVDPWRGRYDTIEALTRRAEDAKYLITRVRSACLSVQLALEQVDEHLAALEQLGGDAAALLMSLAGLEARYQVRLDAINEARRALENTSPANATSLLVADNSSAHDVTNLLGAHPGLQKTGSASSAVAFPAATQTRNRNVQHDLSHTSTSQLPQWRRSTPRALRASNAKPSIVKRALDPAVKPMAKKWTELRGKPLMEAIGDTTVVWLLVLTLAFIGAIATALACWKAGQQVPIPEIDSNFYSTVSQNSIGAGGLYCIMIPILRGQGLDVTQIGLFRFWLGVSGVGALISTLMCPFHLRTSMVLSFLSKDVS